MLDAFSRDFRSIRAQENIGVHSGLPCSSNIFPGKVTLIYMVRSSPSVYRPMPKLVRGPTNVRYWPVPDLRSECRARPQRFRNHRSIASCASSGGACLT
jgi:hypothetical protein